MRHITWVAWNVNKRYKHIFLTRVLHWSSKILKIHAYASISCSSVNIQWYDHNLWWNSRTTSNQEYVHGSVFLHWSFDMLTRSSRHNIVRFIHADRRINGCVWTTAVFTVVILFAQLIFITKTQSEWSICQVNYLSYISYRLASHSTTCTFNVLSLVLSE
jgi:hypothetical protein